MIREYLDEQGWQTFGNVAVTLEESDALHTGQFRISSLVDPDVDRRAALRSAGVPTHDAAARGRRPVGRFAIAGQSSRSPSGRAAPRRSRCRLPAQCRLSTPATDSPSYGQPEHGLTPSTGSPNTDNPSYGQPELRPATPGYGQPQYGQPQYRTTSSTGNPQYGQPQLRAAPVRSAAVSPATTSPATTSPASPGTASPGIHRRADTASRRSRTPTASRLIRRAGAGYQSAAGTSRTTSSTTPPGQPGYPPAASRGTANRRTSSTASRTTDSPTVPGTSSPRWIVQAVLQRR